MKNNDSINNLDNIRPNYESVTNKYRNKKQLDANLHDVSVLISQFNSQFIILGSTNKMVDIHLSSTSNALIKCTFHS